MPVRGGGLKPLPPTCLAILAIVGCKTNDAEPFTPEEGTWTVGDLVATSEE